ncbi:zinc finger, CCHC-type containing protein [Tanacetum coccineum]
MIQELRSMFEKQAGVEKFNLIQSFHACKQEEDKPVADYVLKMKEYVEKLERLGYVLPQDITVGLILNGLTKVFAGFYGKSLSKKAKTPQVMMIKKGKIQKANKKSLKVKGKVIGKGKDKKVYVPKPTNPKPIAKERPAKDDACHHCKEVGHWKRNCPVYLAELLKKKKQVGDASSSATIGLINKESEVSDLYLRLLPSLCNFVESVEYSNLSLAKIDLLLKRSTPATSWVGSGVDDYYSLRDSSSSSDMPLVVMHMRCLINFLALGITEWLPLKNEVEVQTYDGGGWDLMEVARKIDGRKQWWWDGVL